MGRILIISGVVLIVVGLVVQYVDKLPLFGKLPGDILIERNNFKLYIPITTSILLSVLVTIVIYLIGRIKS